jgi:hypothetical protein
MQFKNDAAILKEDLRRKTTLNKPDIGNRYVWQCIDEGACTGKFTLLFDSPSYVEITWLNRVLRNMYDPTV